MAEEPVFQFDGNLVCCDEEEKKEDDKGRQSDAIPSEACDTKKTQCTQSRENVISCNPVAIKQSHDQLVSRSLPSQLSNPNINRTGLTPILASLSTSNNAAKRMSPLTSALLGGTVTNIGNGITVSLSSTDDERRKQLEMTYLAGFRAAVELTKQQQAGKTITKELKPKLSGISLFDESSKADNISSILSSNRDENVVSCTSVNEEVTPIASKNGVNIRRSASMSGLALPSAASPYLSSSTCKNSTSANNNVSNPFPRKLLEILSKESSAIISWLPRGDAFVVRDTDAFVESVLPKYFRHTKLTSFQRQLNLYGFRRVTKGPDQGAYRHEDFHRDKPDISRQMKRAKQKSNSQTGRPRSNSTASASSNGSPALSASTSYSYSDMPELSLSDCNKNICQRNRSMSLGQIDAKAKASTVLDVLIEHKSWKASKKTCSFSDNDSNDQTSSLAAAEMVVEKVLSPRPEMDSHLFDAEIDDPLSTNSSVDFLSNVLLTNGHETGLVPLDNMDLDLDFSRMFEADYNDI